MDASNRQALPLEMLPGGDLVRKGLSDLQSGILSEDALLLLVARPRLIALGFDVPIPAGAVWPYEHALYAAIEARNPKEAHSAYNALIGRIVSFAQALAQVQSAKPG